MTPFLLALLALSVATNAVLAYLVLKLHFPALDDSLSGPESEELDAYSAVIQQRN